MKKVIEGAMVKFTFDGLDPLVFDTAKVSTENRAYAEMHGWMQRLGDEAALSRTEENGYVVTEQMRRDAVAALMEHYHSGTKDWSPVRTKTKTVPQNPTIAAIAVKRGCTYAEAEAYVAEKMLAELE